MPRHTHQYTIADDEAVQVMIDKLLSSGHRNAPVSSFNSAVIWGLPPLNCTPTTPKTRPGDPETMQDQHSEGVWRRETSCLKSPRGPVPLPHSG
jgi:hypothetical protein